MPCSIYSSKSVTRNRYLWLLKKPISTSPHLLCREVSGTLLTLLAFLCLMTRVLLFRKIAWRLFSRHNYNKTKLTLLKLFLLSTTLVIFILMGNWTVLVQAKYSSFDWRQVQSDTAMRNNSTTGYPAHHKQKKISVLRLSLNNPNNRTASTFYNTQSNYD